MRRLRLLLAMTVLAFAATACSSDDADEPSATATASPLSEATATLPPSPTSMPVATAPTPLPGVQRVPSTVWAIDAASGRKTVLFEDLDASVVDAAFVDSGQAVSVEYRPNVMLPDVIEKKTTLTGTAVSTQPLGEICSQAVSGITIRGPQYGPGMCGPVSGDGRWLLFQRIVRQVPSPPGSNYLVPETEMWVLDLSTGTERKLQNGLIHCGGCDGKIGPAFSASGRYVYFAESGGQGRVWLADLEMGTSREITAGASRNEVGREPDFSPIEDAIVYMDTSGRLLVEDLTTRSSAALGVADIPGRFDSSGKIVYAVEGTDRGPQRTHLFDALAASPIGTLEGAPPRILTFLYWLSAKPETVVADATGFIAALVNVPGCTGTGIYDGASVTDCVDAVGASVSPDGRSVALARLTGHTGQVQYPGGGSVSEAVYEILLYDVASGAEQVLASGAITSDLVPPVMTWNEDSSHFLVRWPVHPGL